MSTFDPNLVALPGETAFQWARRTGQYAELKICTCCLIIEANGDPCGDDECDTCKPGGLYEQAYAAGWDHMGGVPFTVTLGAFTDECGHDWQDGDQAEAHSEGCERYGFTQSPCDLCGCHLHGDRYAATLMPREIPDRYRFAPTAEPTFDPPEPTSVDAWRGEDARRIRAWVKAYADDESISDRAFAYALSQFTFHLVKDFAAYSLKVHAEGKENR